MHGRTIILVAILATGALPDIVHAQLSPQGVMGGITRPFREMLGHFGHFPRVHRHRAPNSRPRAAAATPPNENPATAEFRLGWVGPPAWPSAYEDILAFTFWPDDHASRVRSRGFAVISDTISGRFDLPRMSARTATTVAAVRSDADNDSSNRCGDASSTHDNWPATRIKQILELSDTQNDALEKLQAATVQSIKAIKAGCHEPGGLAPPDRLRALVQTLWTVRDAGISVQEPLKNFYDSLTKVQKNNFASQLRPQNAPPDPKLVNAGNKQYQACAAQNEEKAERLVKQIELKVRPKKDHVASLEEFHKVASDMARLLTVICAQPIAADPLARLDAANDHLTAMNYAAATMQIVFDDFYSRLDSNQRARLDSIGR